MGKIIIDHEPSKTTSKKVPIFPWYRYDANRFIYEEALIDGVFVGLHYSAMGRPTVRERLYETYQLANRQIDKRRLSAFDLEIDGQSCNDRWVHQSSTQHKTPTGSDASIITLSHDTKPITVHVHTVVDQSSFMVRHLDIQNTGNEPCVISGLYPWCGLVFREQDTTIARPQPLVYTLGRYKNMNWGMEGEFNQFALPEGTYKIESNKINKFAPNYYVVRNEDTAEMLLIHFEYTGGICVEFTSMNESGGRLRMPWRGQTLHAKIGFGGNKPYYVLRPGETIASPAVHLSMLYGEFDHAANEWFVHLRSSVNRRNVHPVGNPVQFNYAGYSLCVPTTEDMIKKEIDMAKAVGAELFMVDAGWYGQEDNSYAEMFGDWCENPMLQRKLCTCFDYARSKGLMCGLWMAIEIVGPSSEQWKKHRDWCLHDGKRDVLMLDITRPEVETHVRNQIKRVITTYGLDCFRIDGGPEQFCAWERHTENIVENATWRYYRTLYRIIEDMQACFPNVIFENCWGGGGRCDLGIMKYAHWTQITDNWHPEEQLRMLNGMTFSIPPEQCQVFIGAINMNPVDIDFSVRVGLFGQNCIVGLYPSLDKMNEASFARWKHSIRLYKQWMQPLLPICRVFHHTPDQDFAKPGDWVVLEYASPDSNQIVCGLFRLSGSTNERFHLVLKGADLSKKYEVRFDNSQKSTYLSGYELCTTGMQIPVVGRMMSELLLIRSVSN